MNTNSNCSGKKFHRADTVLCQAALYTLDLGLLTAVLLLPAVWLLHSIRWELIHFRASWELRPVLMPFLLMAIRIGMARLMARCGLTPRGLFEIKAYKRLLLALVSVYIFIAACEGMLTLINFRVQLPPIVFIGKTSTGGVEKDDTMPDAKLLFKYIPGSTFAGYKINNLGFREREVEAQKKPGTIRVICMGDSVTAQGRPCYSQYLHERLTNRPPTVKTWEAFNMGVHGYTSLQGLVLFQTLGAKLNPDIVVISYGWNDQWYSPLTDRQQMGLEMRSWSGWLFNLLREKRFFQFIIWSMNPVCHLARLESAKIGLLNKRSDQSANDPFAGMTFRVSPKEYRDTLRDFVKEVRAVGAIPLLMTEASRRLPQEWAYGRQYHTIEEGNRLHDQYMQIMREVARKEQCDLLDLAVIFSGHECDRLFAQDGVHYDYYDQEEFLPNDPTNQPGLRRIAEELDKKIREVVRSEIWRSRR